MTLSLHAYWRSSAAYRVRIALNLKRLPHAIVPLKLVREGSDHRRQDYLERNPQGLVPTLEVDGVPLTQSLAILEWLEEEHPLPPLLPRDPISRAQVRSFALAIACEVSPLCNLMVREYLDRVLKLDAVAQQAWHAHWIVRGTTACEAMIAGGTGPFCFGKAPTIADCVLAPQLCNARRFGVALAPFHSLLRSEVAMLALPAVQCAAPEAQPDAE